jgi:flagellar export protein FliJ
MKKFQFRLERVLRYHQQRLKQAELRVARAALERDAAKTTVANWQQQIDRACQSKETAGSLINPATRTNLTAHLEQLGNSLAMARERLKVAEQRFRETDRMRAEITQAVEGLSQLRELRQQEHRDEINRLLQIDIDEIVMRKWSARNGDDTLLLAD